MFQTQEIRDYKNVYKDCHCHMYHQRKYKPCKNYITNSNLTTTFASYNEQASQSMYPRSTTSSNVPPIDIIPPQSLVSSNKLFLTQVCTLYCSQ